MNENVLEVYNKNYDRKSNNFILLSYIIDKCNFSCNYCYNKFPRTNQILDLNTLYKFVLKIINVKKINNFEIQLIGGEPMLHPEIVHFSKLIKKLNDYVQCNLSLIVFSNFSADISLYDQLLNNGVYLILTAHHNNSNEWFFKKIKKINQKYLKKQIMISIMYEPDYIKQSLTSFDFAKQNLLDDVHELQFSLVDENDNYNKRYSLNDIYEYKKRIVYAKIPKIKIILNNGITREINDNYFFINKKNENFSKWFCNAGLQHLYVHCDGNIYKCDNSILSSRIGNIANLNEFEFPKHGIICNSNVCPCVFDIYKKNIFNVKNPFND